MFDSMKNFLIGKFKGGVPEEDPVAKFHVRIPYKTLIGMMGDIVPLNISVPDLESPGQSGAAELWSYMEKVVSGTICKTEDEQRISAVSAYLALFRNKIKDSNKPHFVDVLEYDVRQLMEKKQDMVLIAILAEKNGSTADMPATPAKFNNPNLHSIFEARGSQPEKVSGRWNAHIIRQFAANMDMLGPFLEANATAYPDAHLPAERSAAPWSKLGRRPF